MINFNNSKSALRAIAIFLSAGLLSFVLLSPAHAETRLGPKQIKSLFPGLFSGTIKDKYEFSLTGHLDGKLIGSGWGITGEGRWTIEQNKLCMHFWILKNGVKCRKLYRTGNNQYIGRRDDGKIWMSFKRLPLPRRAPDSTPAPFKAQY